MKRISIAFSALLLIATPVSHVAFAAFIDNINGAASPVQGTEYLGADRTIGWYYTPTSSFNLTGIYSVFGSVVGSTATRSVTVQIQSERPTLGGVVLASGTFPVSASSGGQQGSSFAAIPITAGQTYFVDFLNVSGIGVNLGTWANDSMGHPQPAGGATQNLGNWYEDASTGFATVYSGYGYATDGVTPIAGGEPILLFEGYVTPEPSSIFLSAVGLIVLWRRFRAGEAIRKNYR